LTRYNPDIKEFLEEKVAQYNRKDFIDTDPVFVPHQFTQKEDIEIAGFLTATLSWGNRKAILKSALKLVHLMDNAPYDFVINHQTHHLDKFDGFVHRTFNAADAKYFMKALQHIYRHEGGLEKVFSFAVTAESVIPAISHFHEVFFSLPHPKRTCKHVSYPDKGSPAKRINMFLRWMARQDHRGVDFGIWKSINPRQLSCPLDIHSGNVARKLGLLTIKQNNLKALHELDTNLRSMDAEDPVKYDFALFGLGVFERF
jgi:uncharacterized protein (TIGR02757 family)